MDVTDQRLLNDFQRGFPLVPEPWSILGAALAIESSEVLHRLSALLARGAVSRVGAVFAPRTVGASTLAALSAPRDRLEEIAATVSACPGVNHNYEREHALNLWFVATAENERVLGGLLAGIERDTGCTVLRMPLMAQYHIDLGFDLCGGHGRRVAPGQPARIGLRATERRLLAALEEGLALVPRPWARLAMQSGMTESGVLETLEGWLAQGVIRRIGVIVRHQELGYTANAMCVWDVPDDAVAESGRLLAADSAVTLCYQRERALPEWPFNLYCMIHGTAREPVLRAREGLSRAAGLEALPQAVLFSRRRFKQQAAHYGRTRAEVRRG